MAEYACPRCRKRSSPVLGSHECPHCGAAIERAADPTTAPVLKTYSPVWFLGLIVLGLGLMAFAFFIVPKGVTGDPIHASVSNRSFRDLSKVEVRYQTALVVAGGACLFGALGYRRQGLSKSL